MNENNPKVALTNEQRETFSDIEWEQMVGSG